MSTAITVAELCILGLAGLPLLRLLADRRLRRLFPRAYAAPAGLLLAWAAAAVLLALYLRIVLHPLAVLAALALAVTTVRARPGFGRARGLPPGSLSLGASVRALSDRRFYLDQASRHGPVFKMAQFHRGTVCVVGLERGHRLLREHAAALGSAPQPFTHEISGGFLRYMDDETYRLYGPLFRKALVKPVIVAAATVTAEATRRELLRLAEDCARFPAGAVRPAPHLRRIVHDAFLRALFGVIPGTEEYRRFESSYPPLAAQDLGAPLTSAAREALTSLRGVLLAQAEQARGSANGKAPASALTELQRIDARMPDLTCLDNLLFALKISSANVVALLHWILDLLGRHDDWVARARAELGFSEANGEPDLVDRIVMETLRLAQSEYLYRVVAADIDFEGFRLPKGWLVRLCVWESHRSAEIFEDPEAFNPDRFLPDTFQTSEYSPFGWAQHACNGVPLNNMICRTVIEELISGFEWQVTGNGPAERDFRHWSHWRPSSELAVGLTSIGGPAGD